MSVPFLLSLAKASSFNLSCSRFIIVHRHQSGLIIIVHHSSSLQLDYRGFRGPSKHVLSSWSSTPQKYPSTDRNSSVKVHQQHQLCRRWCQASEDCCVLTSGRVQLAALVVVGCQLLVADGQRVQRAQQVLNNAVRVPARVHTQAPPPLRHQPLPRRRLPRALREQHACASKSTSIVTVIPMLKAPQVWTCLLLHACVSCRFSRDAPETTELLQIPAVCHGSSCMTCGQTGPWVHLEGSPGGPGAPL